MFVKTDDASFIGADFAIDWIAQTDDPIVSLDKRICAGNLEALASLQCDARYVYKQRYIGDTTPVACLLESAKDGVGNAFDKAEVF